MRTVIDFFIYPDQDNATIQFENGSTLEIEKQDYFNWLDSEYGLNDFKEDKGEHTDNGEGSFSKFLELNETSVINYYRFVNHVQRYVETLPDLELIGEIEILHWNIQQVKKRLEKENMISGVTCDIVNVHLDRAMTELKSLQQIEISKSKKN